MTDYPEHDKLKGVKDKSQAIHDFVFTFLSEKGVVLAERQTDENLEGELVDGLYPYSGRLTSLVAEFLEIDENKLEAEKLQMLDEIRKANIPPVC